jgi:hypothetical protein
MNAVDDIFDKPCEFMDADTIFTWKDNKSYGVCRLNRKTPDGQKWMEERCKGYYEGQRIVCLEQCRRKSMADNYAEANAGQMNFPATKEKVDKDGKPIPLKPAIINRLNGKMFAGKASLNKPIESEWYNETYGVQGHCRFFSIKGKKPR